MKKVDSNVSCSELIKSTARSIIFKKDKKRKFNYIQKPSEAQEKGVKHQEKISESEYKEMRGVFNHEDFNLFYSFDEVKVKPDKLIFIEHKNIEDMRMLEQWYIEYSIIQVALYASLVEHTNYLSTASFYKKQGYETKEIFITDQNKKFKLIFGNTEEVKELKIKVLDSQKIIDFYLNKLEHTKIDDIELNQAYNKATIWDSKFKRKEFSILKEYIKIS